MTKGYHIITLSPNDYLHYIIRLQSQSMLSCDCDACWHLENNNGSVPQGIPLGKVLVMYNKANELMNGHFWVTLVQFLSLDM